MSKLYFPNFNGLRFFAALAVIIHHTEQFKSFYEIENHWGLNSIKIIGNLGVTFFFVLSGFLITYFLIFEKKNHGFINYKYFFFRRLLRIWPLYFLIILLSFFVFPELEILHYKFSSNLNYDFQIKLILFLLFLPNLVFRLYPMTPFASQTWSIGVEEQFYLIWPLVISYFKKLKIVFIFSIILFPVFKLILIHFSIKTGSTGTLYFVSKIFSDLSISSLALGSLAAYFVVEKKSIVNLFHNKWLYRATITFLCVLVFFGVEFKFIHYEIYSLLFTIIILYLGTSYQSKNSVLESNFFKYLGKISYGIYMYHPICIVLSINVLLQLDLLNNFNLYISTLLMTIVISSISYEYFESKFLKLKKNYMTN